MLGQLIMCCETLRGAEGATTRTLTLTAPSVAASPVRKVPLNRSALAVSVRRWGEDGQQFAERLGAGQAVRQREIVAHGVLVAAPDALP